jgi:hypothetical protein
MSLPNTIYVLNQLLAVEYRSLPMYLTNFQAWTHAGDERAAATLKHIIIDQTTLSKRIADMIYDRRGTVEFGDFPMEFTDTHDLSLDYLIREILRNQMQMIVRIESLIARLADDREARELAQETLGSERAHLEALRELVVQPA